jgi:hypothetical protein
MEFKYTAQKRIYQEIKNLSPKKEIEYFNLKAKEGFFKDFVESLIHTEKEVIATVE